MALANLLFPRVYGFREINDVVIIIYEEHRATSLGFSLKRVKYAWLTELRVPYGSPRSDVQRVAGIYRIYHWEHCLWEPLGVDDPN